MPSSFDTDAYFKNRALTDEKLAQLAEASKIKVRELTAYRDAPAATPDTSWSTQLGLSPGGFAANRVNDAASVVAGASRLVGQVASLPFGIAAGGSVDSLDSEDYAAANRVRTQVPQPGDLERLARGPEVGKPTVQDRLAFSEKQRTNSKGVVDFFDLGGIVQQNNRQSLAKDLAQGFQPAWDQTKAGWEEGKPGDVASGLANLLLNAGSAIVSNPAGVREYVLENAPQLFVGAAGKAGMAAMSASNVGYAVDAYSQGVQAYQAKNGGTLPSEELRRQMIWQSAQLALAEQAGDVVGLGLTKVAGKAAEGAARTSFMTSLKNASNAAVKAAITEAPTEGYQTYLEGEIAGKPASALDVYIGAAIGAASGGVLSGGGRAVAEVLEATPEHAAERAVTQTRKEAQAAAVVSGDVSALVDPKSPVYAPSKAIAALHGNSSLPGATPETRQASFEQASEIVSKLQAERDTAQDAYDAASPEGLRQAKALLATLKTKLAGESDPAKAKDLRESVEMVAEQVASASASALPPKELESRKLALSKANRLLDQAQEGLARFNENLSAGADIDVAAQAGIVNTQVDEKDAAAVSARSAAAASIINLSMAIPERLDTAVADSLASNLSNGLTAPQRDYLRAFSAARVAENQLKTLDKVSQDIYFGGGGNVGIEQHRQRAVAALAAGNQALADRQLKVLQNFEQDHRGKAAAVAAAWEEGKGTQTYRTKDGKWSVSATRRTRAELRKSGDLEVNTEKLVTDISTESKAITATLAEVTAAYAVKFPTLKSGATHVPVVPQAHAPAQTQPAVQQAPTAVGSPAAAPGRVPAANTGGDVGSAGVEVAGVGTAAAARVAQDSQETEVPAGTVRTEVQEASGVAEVKGTVEGTNGEVTQPVDAVDVTTPEPVQVGEPTEKPAVASGSLDVMGAKSAEGTAYNLRNLIADFFTQSASREGDATQRPLVAVKGFLSQGWESAQEFVAQPLPEQVEVLRVFKETASKWSGIIQKNLGRRQPKAGTQDPKLFYFKDMLQFLITESVEGKLDLEENVKTAMSYAAFSWVAAAVTRPAQNSPEEMNLILGRDEDHHLEEREKRALLNIGTRQSVVMNSLGQGAVDALGLKPTKDAPVDLMPRLVSQLGGHIFKLLMDEGILERSTVSGTEMAALTGSEATSKDAAHFFLKLARDDTGKVHPKAGAIFQATKGTQSVLDKLFGVESALKEPTLEPVKFTQATTRNTRQGVPSKLKEAVERDNAGAWQVSQDMFHLVSGLDEDIVLQLAGGITVDPTEAHVANRESNEAKNDGLRRELQRFKDFLSGLQKPGQDDGLSTSIYFDHSAWKQQRVGISTNAVNPQSSKLQRHMLFRPSWETKVSRGDAAQMENFHLRVAEGLGVKVDKQSNKKSLIELFEKKLDDPKIQAAIQVLQKRIAGDAMNAEEQARLLEGVKVGGENFHTLSALMALAHEANAPGKDFTVRLMGEIDGVTNGPMLSHLLLGAASTAKGLFGLINRGGFFEVDNKHSQYNLWRDPEEGNFDLYETTAGHMVQDVAKLIASGLKTAKGKVWMQPGTVKTVMGAIYSFTGTLAEKDGTVLKAGRNIVKTPLTAMVFGSSVSSAVESMANNFIESIYAGIEDTAKGVKNSKSVQETIENLNLLLTQADAPGISTKSTIADLMELEFHSERLEGLKNIFKQTVGAAVRTTMETDFAAYIAQRQQVNLAAQTAFALYDAVYRGLREQLVSELVAAGTIAVNEKTGRLLHDLTPPQESELRKRLNKLAPVAHTLMSKDSRSLNAGLYLAKSGRKLSAKETYSGEVRFGTPFADNNAKTTVTHGYEVVEAEPGVAPVPMLTHSLDSAISHYAAMLGEVLNVHDAHGVGLANFEQTARNLNQATWNALLNYSPASEVQAALSRTVVDLANLIQEGDLPPAVMSNLTAAIKKIAGKQELSSAKLLSIVMTGAKSTAFQADNIKLQALAQMGSIDQYALQGGNYVVTEKDRADASALRAGLSDALSEKEISAVTAIEAALGLSTDEATKVETPLEEDPPKAKENPFGEVGTPAKANQALVDFFKANPEVSAAAAIKQLMTMVGAAAPGARPNYHAVLLDLLIKAMPKDVKVKLITPEMTQKDVIALPKTKSFGWIVGNEIYILSEGFVNSGLQTPEVLLHELVHGALAQVVENPSKAGQVLVSDLKSLMAQAAAYAKQNGITEFDAALSGVHEFIAYGMTRTAFQRLLAQVSVEEKAPGAKTSTLINGLKRFISTLTGLLFDRLGLAGVSKKDQVNTALGGLIENVSGLLNQAEKDVKREGATNAPNLSMVTNTYSTLDIHNALDGSGVTQQFDGQLRELLSGIVQRLHGPFGTFKEALMKGQALSAQDVWLKALATGVAPFASSVAVSPLKASEQEAHAMEQVEAVMRAALERDESTTSGTYHELEKLFDEAASFIKPSDFASQDEYDFIFKVEVGANGRSDHLARFAAFGLAHQGFNTMLQVNTQAKAKPIKGSFAERLQAVFERVLEFFYERLTNTYGGQRADTKLNLLVSQLVDIEAKRRLALARRANESSILAPLEAGAKSMVEAGIAKVVEVAGSNAIRNNSRAVVRVAGSAVRVVANHQVDAFLEVIADMRARHWKERLGFVAGTLSYAIGGSKILEALLRQRKILEGTRKDVITQGSKTSLQSFTHAGTKLSKLAKESVTQVFMRTGMHVLTDQFNLVELENLLGNKTALDAAINTLEAQLTGFGPLKNDFISQANALAYFKVTGRNKAKVLMMNAHNISRLYGTAYAGKIPEAKAKQAEPVIEKLVALYALGYVSSTDMSRAKEVLRTENARTDGGGNGVGFVLAFQKRMGQESKARLFQGQEALMAHGYTSEIYSPHVDVLTADAVAGAQLERQGYKKGGPVENDPDHPDQTRKHLYVLEGGGLMPYLTGSVSYTGKNAKGSKQHSGYMNINTADGLANAALHADIMHAKKRSLAAGPRKDLSKASRTYMAPVVNPQGEIVNWRYLMQDSTKDSVLKRENRFDMVLGTMAGSIYDKDTATELNTKIFVALKEQYDAEKGTAPHAYVMIGPKSPDAEAREIWSMLPDESKAEARRIWGRDGLFVRNDARDIVFGYRKLSLASAIRDTQKRRVDDAARVARGMPPEEIKGLMAQLEATLATIFTAVLEHALTIHARVEGKANPEEYGARAAVLVTKGERMWQEIVGEVKDLLVVKTVTVLMGNFKSNISLHILSGVPLKDILRGYLVALRGATTYQNDSQELSRLQLLIDTQQTNGKEVEIRKRMARLEDALARNPVRELMEAGLMPTIVEDAAADEDPYSYKSQLVQSTERFTGKLHPSIQAAGKVVYMARDTKMYQGLRRITQLSDFVARYTQYQYLTTRKENPLSKADAIQEASDYFINYDIPMQRGMQYLDDMGIVPFMKYFLRIQKVLGKVAKDNPARVLSAVLFGNILDLGPIVLDSSWIHKAGNNPLHWGAFQFPGSLDELATVNATIALVK